MFIGLWVSPWNCAESHAVQVIFNDDYGTRLQCRHSFAARRYTLPIWCWWLHSNGMSFLTFLKSQGLIQKLSHIHSNSQPLTTSNSKREKTKTPQQSIHRNQVINKTEKSVILNTQSTGDKFGASRNIPKQKSALTLNRKKTRRQINPNRPSLIPHPPCSPFGSIFVNLEEDGEKVNTSGMRLIETLTAINVCDTECDNLP